MNSVFILSLIAFCLSGASCSTISTTTPVPGPNVWVLLIAASNGWDNYRHQGDICRAYHIFKKSGIPETNIVLMMYDDIANNPRNPTPGIIIGPDGDNVYEGVVKDYTGKDVTPDNFLNVLQGKKELMRGIGSGKVIDSGPDDYVFVNFVGHGSHDMLLFMEKYILLSNRILGSLVELTNNKRFAKLFIFVDAEESGSIFNEVLEDNTNIFVMTSSDLMEGSAAEAFNATLGVFLTNCFSENWIFAVKTAVDLSTISFHHIFQKVRYETSSSHVQEFGDLDIGNTMVAEIIKKWKQFRKNESDSEVSLNLQKNNAVPQTEVKLAAMELLLENAIKKGQFTEIRRLKKMITNEIHRRLTQMKKTEEILRKITKGDPDKMKFLGKPRRRSNDNALECYNIAVEDYFTSCLNFPDNEFMYPVLKYFLAACNVEWTNIERIKSAISSVCRNE